jgi:uncharacterized protein (TIGR02466 family)
MANIELWFPTPIYIQKNLFPTSFNKEIENEILKWPNTIPSGGTDWEGGTYTTHITHDLSESKLLEPVIECVTEHVNDFAKAHNSMYEYKMEHSWANISRPGNFQEFHTHDGSIFSAVYYVTVPKGSGNIIFEDPRAPDMLPLKEIKDRNELSYVKVGYTPEVGTLVIFRSYVRHCVQTGTNVEPRISLALNYG